jgi:hypothetical protein
MIKKNDVINIIIALLMYLPTMAFMPNWLYLLLIPISIYLNKNFIKNYFSNLLNLKITDKYFTFFILFAILAFIFRIIDYSNWASLKDFYSFAYLFPFTYIVAKTVSSRKTIYKYIIYLIILESAFCILEYIFGVSTFFSSLKLHRHFESYQMLYYTRVFGLSANSSGLTLKLIFGIILLDKTDWNFKIKKAIELLFLIISIMTFGRIAIIALFIYYFLKITDAIIKKDFNWKSYIPFFMFFLFFSVNPIWTKNQFTRNDMKVSSHSTFEDEDIEEKVDDIDMSLLEEFGLANINMSGRSHIWTAYTMYGYKHPFFGYKGKKFMLGHVHAHNSYLQMFASFGIFMLMFIVIMIATKINKSNYVIIISLLILSFGQYLIFWGISFYDIIFYSLLFYKQPLKLDEK